jgi:hypothetical protein
MKTIKELYPGKKDQHIINILRKKYDTMELAYKSETQAVDLKCIYCDRSPQFISIFKGYKEICSSPNCQRNYFIEKNNERIQRDKEFNKISVKCNVCERSEIVIQNTNKNKNKSNVCQSEFCLRNKERSFLLETHIIENFNFEDLSYLNTICYELMVRYRDKKKVRRILNKNLLIRGIEKSDYYIEKRVIKDILCDNFFPEKFERTRDNLYFINLEKKDKENVLKIIYGKDLEKYIFQYFPDKFKNCSICGKKYRFSNVFTTNRKSKETCSIECYRKNFKFYVTDQRKEKQRNSMLEKIRKGEFTPNVFNSMTHKNIELKTRDGIMKFRSSWEILFYVMNPGYLYENLRIEYNYEGKKRLYLVDFINTEEKKVVEIKPKSKEIDPVNLTKMKSLNDWGSINKFEIITISENELKEYTYSDFLNRMKNMEYEVSEDLLLKIKKILERK